MNSPTIRPPFGPSTPTHRSLTPSLSTSTTSSAFVGHALSSTSQTAGSNYRSSSPCLRLDQSVPPLRMDIRNGGPRLSGSTLFPQSIRSNNSSSRALGRA
nr:hypothetical protein [Tanacetum cinerariifolium]